MRGLKKLVTKPGIYFRDYFLKRYPLPAGKAHRVPATARHSDSQNQLKIDTAPVKKTPSKMETCEQHYLSRFNELHVTPNTYLFDSYWGKKIGCNPYAVFKELRKRPEAAQAKFIWVRDRKVRIPHDVRNAHDVQFVEFLSPQYAEALLRAEHIISNMTLMPFFSKRPGQRYHNLWHGVPIKTLGLDANPELSASANTQRNFLIADKVLLSSDYAVEKTINPHNGALSITPHAVVTGSPRVDLTLEADQALVRQRLGITNKKPIILYAPTWRGTHGKVAKGYGFQLTAIETLEDGLGDTHNILVSLHHLDLANIPSISNRVAQLVPDHVDMNEVLKAVDVLVSDYSSIIVDYLVLDRPIVQFLPDRKEYEGGRGLYLAPEQMPTAIVERASELRFAINDARKPSSFSQFAQIKDLLLLHEDGKAASRAVDVILSPVIANSGASKKKILIFGGNLITNGVTSSLLSLLENIDKNAYDVSLMVDAPTIDEAPIRRANLAKVERHCEVLFRAGTTALRKDEASAYARLRREHDVSSEDWLLISAGFTRETRRVLGETFFDVAIEFGGYAPYWALFMANTNADRKVIYQHNDLFAEATNPHKDRQKPALHAVFRCYKFFDAVVSVSKEVMTMNHLKLGEFYPERLDVCHARNSISPAAIKDRASVPLALISEKAAVLAGVDGLVKFISLARLSPEKNHRRAIDAFSRVLEERINAVLYVVGYGPLEVELREYVQAQGLSDRVIFTGELTNPHPLLASCDCLVFPSDYEGQGLVLLEALTLGVSCIGTDIPPVAAILEGGVGRVVAPNSEAFAQAMIEFARSAHGPVKFDPVEYTERAMAEFYRNVLGVKA